MCRQSNAGMSFATWDVGGAVGTTAIATDESIGFPAWLSADGRALFRLTDDRGNELGHVEHLSLDAPGVGRGKLIADCTVAEFIAAHSRQQVRVRTPQPELLARLAAGYRLEQVIGPVRSLAGDLAPVGG